MKFDYTLAGRNVYTYEAYREMIDQLLEAGKTTGPIQTEDKVEFTRLNVVRMNRLDKRAFIDEDLKEQLAEMPRQVWLVVAEAWCGDASQNLPYLKKMADVNPLIDLRIVLRDENTDIIDGFLTNGGRAIPKLIAIDDEGDIAFTWGARPVAIQEEFLRLKEQGLPKAEVDRTLQLLYSRDKGQSLQDDFRVTLSRFKPVLV